MKLLAITIFRNGIPTHISEKPFFFGSNVVQIYNFLQAEVEKRTEINSLTSVKENAYVITCYKTAALSCTVITDESYPKHVVNQLIHQMVNEKEAKVLKQLFDKYQDPKNVDTITEVRATVSSIKETMIDNIEKMLDRGQKIEDVVKKTDMLTEGSKKFLIEARKTNSCCAIL